MRASPSGKASAFQADIREFESRRPLQRRLQFVCWRRFLYSNETNEFEYPLPTFTNALGVPLRSWNLPISFALVKVSPVNELVGFFLIELLGMD